ncbi:MAG: ankyrin repeat domain-containing protein [Wolbachia endosymbiont of Homalodisca vitripennis]|nr:ankyrin repeat domain-containing protein [Wolbachia endosymbiont of Homalodisca vitripennis]
MNKKDTAYTKNLSRVIPDNIEGARMICLPQITNQDYEKGITSSVSSAEYYCENAVVISRSNANHANPTIIYDLHNVVDGRVIGSNEWNNNFLIDKGNIEITGSNNVVTGGDNVVNKFVFLDTPSSSGKVIGGRNSTNILDLSEAKKDRNIRVAIQDNIVSGNLKVRINGRVLVNSVDPSNYYYVGRKRKMDEILCMGHSTHSTRHEVIVDSGGVEGSERDIVENCKKVILSPYTTVLGREGSYTFYVRVTNLKGKNLHSEINVDGTGTVVFSEFDLLSDCEQVTYSTSSNTLSLKINLGQNNQFTLDIKNYVEQSSNKPHFVLIDKNGNNIVPKIERSESATIKINSFELHSEHSLDNFDDVETHYKKILNNNKDYKVFSVIRDGVHNQGNSAVPHMVFGSLEDDVINFDQGTMFASGGGGSDVYVITDDINNKEVKIDNNSDDEKMDTLFMPEVEKDFSIQQCDLYLKYNNSNIRVKNYLQDSNYRHLIIMNKKGEAFIPNIQSMSCSSSGKGKLVPFLQATQTQNMFLLPKDFADDHVVIDSRLEDIEKYKDKDDLLLIRESGIPFIIRMEGFYTDRSKWENISYSLWNNNDFVPSSGLLENVDNVMEYKDKLRNDYERIVKEYTEDFSDSTSIIQHNHKLEENISTSIGQDEERIGVMVLKNITPDQVEVSSSGTDLIFRDKRSNHKINIKGWESYRISKLEFDLGLEPIKILRLNRFSLSEVKEIQSLIDKASQNYQSREEYTSRVEDDFRCLISIHSLMKKPIYQCSGFFSLQDQANFVKSACNREQIEEFENKMPSTSQFMMLLEKLHNDLSLNGYNQDTIDKCSRVVTSGFGVLNLWINKAVDEDKWDEVQTLLDRTANRSNADVEHKSKCSKSWTLLNYFVYNGNVDLGKDIFKLILKKSGSIDALEDGNGWAALHYAVHYGDFNMASFLVDEGAKVDVKNKEGKTPLYLVIEEAKKNKLDMIKLLVERGADIEAKDNDGKSPLYLITYSGDLDTIKLLFEMIKAKDNSSLKTIKEIDSLRRKIFNQQNIPFYVRSFVDSYVSGVVQTVAKELRDNVSMHGCAAIVKFGDEIYEFNKELFKEIIREFISVVYGKTLNSDGILECINSYNHTEEKIYSYIALLDEMKRNDHLSDNAAFKLAYNVKEIIGSGEKYDLREIKNRLPGCVNDVVFPSKVCIKNVNFGEYLYPTDTKVTDDRRVVATDSISRATWKIEFKDGKFYIISNEGEYLYAADYAQYDDERRSVFTWVGGDQVKNDEWNIIPKGDICDLVNVGQREYLYSPVDYFKGKYSGGEMFPGLRPVFTWIGGSQVTNSEWKFEDCSRSRRKRDVEELGSEVSLDSRPFQVVRGRENSNDTQVLELSARLQNNLLPSSHSDEGIVHWYSRPGNEDMLNKMMSSALASVKEVIYLDQSNSRLDLDSCSKNNASSCPPLMRNIYNTINLDKKNVITDKKNVLEVTSGYERLDIENFPIQEKVINVNRRRSLLDLSKLVKQVDVDLGIKPIPMIVKEKNDDLLIKLSISAIGLKKDVVTVRLKDALINNSYKNLQIVFDSAPVEIDNNLKLTPSILISDSKIIVVTPQNIEEGNKLIICREIEGYTFLHHKYDLIMTNALSANVSEKELYVMYFKDFYKEPKMKTLSIRFIDKEILLDDKINKIYNSDNIDKFNHVSSILDLEDRGTNIKANDFHDDKVLKLAYCIKEVIEKTNNKEEISSFERLKNKLPESVKNIVFSPTACIKNVISDGYLYASSNKFRYNHERRVVSTQVGGRKNQQVFWKVDPSHGNSYIENVEFNECLHPPVNDMHSSEGRNIFTLIRRGGTQCNFWKFEPVGENVRIQDAQSGGYLYVPIHNSKHNNNGSNVGTERTKDEKSLWRFEDCRFIRNKRDIKQLESKVSLDSKTIKGKKRASGDPTSVLSEKLQRNVYLSRKPLAIDISSQPEIAASGGTRPSSWMNICISWAKNLATRTFSIIPGLPTQYSIADKNNVKNDNKNIPQTVGWNKFLNNENIALASCVADALDNIPSRRYQGLMSKGVEVVPSRRVAVDFALKKFNSFVEDKIRNLESKEQARIRVELKGAYPEIIAGLERGVEFSGNVGLDNVLEKCKKCFCTNVLPKDKVSTCLSEIGVTKLGGNLNR